MAMFTSTSPDFSVYGGSSTQTGPLMDRLKYDFKIITWSGVNFDNI